MSEIYSLLQNSDVDFVEFAKDESTLFFPAFASACLPRAS